MGYGGPRYSQGVRASRAFKTAWVLVASIFSVTSLAKPFMSLGHPIDVYRKALNNAPCIGLPKLTKLSLSQVFSLVPDRQYSASCRRNISCRRNAGSYRAVVP